MSKNCTQLWREARSEVKMYKTHTMFLPLLEVEMSKKCTPLWREAHFQVNMLKTQKRTTCSDHFWTFRCRFAWQAQRILHLPKSEQNAKVLQQFKNVGRRGTCEQDLQRCISRGRRIQETCSPEMLGGQAADFLRAAAFWSIRSVGLLR